MSMKSAVLIVVLGLCACADTPDEGGDSSSSDGTTSTASTTSPTTTSPTTTSPTTTDPTTSGTSESSTGDESSTAPSDSSDSTGEPAACDFDTEVDAALAESEKPTDCGDLTAADALSAWEDGRACSRDALLHQQAFRLVWQTEAGGVLHDRAFASNGAGTPLVYLVDDAADGTTSITIVNCTGTGMTPDCTVAVGEMCLDCLEPTVAIELCE